jgi:hypothetical protein
MSYELWAIDAGAGEAVLRQGQRWFLLSLDYDWEPREMRGESDAFKWAVSGPVVPVGIQYASLSGAIDNIRRVCLVAIEGPEPLSSEYVLLLLAGDGAKRPSSAEESHARGSAWEKELREIVRLYSRRLDRYFESKGLSRDKVFELRCETLRRAGEGVSSSARKIDLGRWVFGLAQHAYLELGGNRLNQRGEDEHQSEIANLWWLPAPRGEAEWGGNLDNLSEEDLLCLGAWSRSETNYSYEQVAVGLHMPVQRVRECLERVAELLGRSPEELRDSSLRQACLEVIQKQQKSG